MRDIQSFRYRLVAPPLEGVDVSRCYVCLWFFERCVSISGRMSRIKGRRFARVHAHIVAGGPQLRDLDALYLELPPKSLGSNRALG